MSTAKRCRAISVPESERESERRYLRIAEAASYLNTTPWQIRSLIWNRTIPYMAIGKRHVLDKRDLDLYAQTLKVAPA